METEVTSVGGRILGLVTAGMYDDPMSVYREYVQNAVDSIHGGDGIGRIDIILDLRARRVVIRDNGPGLEPDEARRQLISIANSKKMQRGSIGFRGIGRLAGLAFANSVSFRTRGKSEDPVMEVVWKADALREGVESGLALDEIMARCASLRQLEGNHYPTTFFEVQIDGISRYAASSILNRGLVKSYVAEVCPVPFSREFPYLDCFRELFKEGEMPLEVDIFINGHEEPIKKRHLHGIPFGTEGYDGFCEFERIEVPQLGSDRLAAVGWVAHSSYLGALPKSAGIRGIRVRAGNIQVGSESVFDRLFQESRFNRWCVGEVHILDQSIRPNARRDYFELNSHIRNLENHIGAVCRRLEKRCRYSSSMRSAKRRVGSTLDELQATHDLASSGYLTAKAVRELIDDKIPLVSRVRRQCQGLEDGDTYVEALDGWENRLQGFHASPGRPSFPGVRPNESSVYREFFRLLTRTSPSARAAKEMIEAILSQKMNSTGS